jgi:hypothetical protein
MGITAHNVAERIVSAAGFDSVGNLRFRFLLLFTICSASLPYQSVAQTYIYNQAAIATGNQASSFIVADFNGDGIPDLAIANQGNNTVSVVLSRADGSFSSKKDYQVGTAPTSLVSGDFNGDHILDLAVINSKDDTVSVLLGVGAGKFSSQVTYLTGGMPVGIVAADFNGDSKLDLAVVNEPDSTVSVLLGNGDGTFVGQTPIPVVPSPVAIVAGDFNGDGLPDLVSLPSQGTPSLLLNKGNGTFSVQTTSINLKSMASAAVGDFNNDGIADLAIADPINSTIFILLGSGSGAFNYGSASVSFPPAGVAVEDFNSDGLQDLAVAGSSGYYSSIIILLGDGNGGFRQPANSFLFSWPGPTALAAADFNNDGYIDVAALDPTGNVVAILLGDGQGNLPGHRDWTLPASAGIGGSATADFNGDGKLDLAVVQFNQNGNTITGSVSVVPGNGDGTFQQAISTPVPNVGIDTMVVGDFLGNGKADIATAPVPTTGGISVILGNGDGTFGVVNAANVPGTGVQYMVGGDFNNDGKGDLATLSLSCANACSPVNVLLSNGDGTFNVHLVANVAGIATNIAAGDFNNDGNLDLVVIDPTGAVNPSVLVFLGNGNGTFSSPTSYSTGTLFTNTASVADFNGDGKLDLAIGTEQGIFFFAGNGDGTFQAPTITPTPYSIIRAAVGDFNGDGKPDLAITGNSGLGTAIALGNGDGTFRGPLPFEATFYPRGIVTSGDFNGDGTFDLLQFSTSDTLNVVPQTVSVWLSTPTLSFSAPGLSFGPGNVGTSSLPATISLTNSGNSSLSMSSIAASGSFSQTNNCPSHLPIGKGCSAQVVFTPAVNGLNPGYLTFTDDGRPGTQSLPLTGWAGPPDFVPSVSPSSVTVKAGSSASYSLLIASGDAFAGIVQVSCSGAPSRANCALSTQSVQIVANSTARVQVTVSTAAQSSAELFPASFPTIHTAYKQPIMATFCIALACVWGGLLFVSGHRRARFLLALGLGLVLAGCGGSGSGATVPPPVTGTPPGNYKITLTMTSGNSTHSLQPTLVVQ